MTFPRKISVVLALLLAGLAESNGLAQTTVGNVTLTLDRYYDVQPNGLDTTWMHGFTHRYVNGQLRFLSLTHTGLLKEFTLSGQTTAEWNLAGRLSNFNGLWWEATTERLFITGSVDYTAERKDAWIRTLSLGANGSITNDHMISASNIPEKRMYGGCRAVPSAWRTALGGAYVCGWGGYTSLVAQAGGASIGPTMYAFPDPASLKNGATVRARVVLDASNSRGYRVTNPVNYFDSGDPRQNPSTRPTQPPVRGAGWLSPEGGHGWMTWGDSYYNTGLIIGDYYLAIASLCKGSCWYESSTLAFDGRQYEAHVWSLSRLKGDPLTRPDAMVELSLPKGSAKTSQTVWGGNIPTGNIAGATYDETTGKLYLVSYPAGEGVDTGRIWQFSVAIVGSPR